MNFKRRIKYHIYKSVRLAYEAKVWIDELFKIKNVNARTKSNNFLSTLEQTLLSNQ